MTSSPVRNASARKARCNASSPLATPTACFASQYVREFGFESLDLRPENIPAAVENARHGPINVRLQFEIGFAKIEERNLRHLRSCAAR